MNCPTCSADLAPGQKFCPQCGANVAAATLPAPPAGPLAFSPPASPRPDPSPAITSPIAPVPPAPETAAPTVAARISPLAPPTTDSFAIVEQTVPVKGAEPPSVEVPSWVNSWADETRSNRAHLDHTDENQLHALPGQTQLVIGPATEAVPYPAGFGPNAITIAGRGSSVLAAFAGLAGIAAIVGALLPVFTVSTDAPIPDVGDYKLNDLLLGTNVIIAVIVAGVCMIAGGVLAMLGKRIGAGLAGGAALALAPFLLVIWGGIAELSNRAEARAFAAAQAGQGGTFFTSKQGPGLWILIAAAGIGVIGLFIAVVQAGGDGRPRLNTFVGLFGALAAVVAALGQTIPGDSTSFGDNFDTALAPGAIVYGRVAMIAVVAVVAAVGFLMNNRWGVGLALGSVSIWVWQWLSSLIEAGDISLPPGFLPLTDDGKPHIVTTVGVVAVLVVAAVSILTAPRNRPIAR